LADALLRFQQAKQAAVKMAELYKVFSGRMAKDTDEISIDTTYVADQQVTSLCLAVRRIIAANESRPKAEKTVFAPMIAKPIVPVEVKIVGILHRMSQKNSTSMEEILSDATSLPDLIAIFLGILELVKVRKILIEDGMFEDAVHGTNTVFTVNDTPPSEEEQAKKAVPNYDPNEPIPLSSKAEMHREQRRIIREQKLAEKKRLREEERARRREEKLRGATVQNDPLPVDDRDLEEEARVAALLEEQLSDPDEDLLDDIGLDMTEIISHMAKRSMEFSSADDTEENQGKGQA